VNASQVIAEEYMGKTKGARIAVTGGGSGVGISSLINGTADIGMASRDIKASEKEAATAKGLKLEEVVIGFDGITVISNPNNPVKNLSSKDLGRIFRGEAKNWKEFGGNDAEIVILSRDSSSGTHEFFKEHVVREGNSKGTQEYAEKTLYMPSNESIKQEIRANKNAIGYIGMGYMDDTVNGITVDEISPSLENVSEKKYPIARAIYWYVGDMNNPDIKGIVDYAVSPEGQKIIKEEGFVPVK
ncbi:MAG: PstS family phosphate ABC transporter substrate-binding protein, partial [Cetobacterium sp.]